MSWHDAAEAEGYYATTGWSIADVHAHREALGWPKWCDAKATEWLQRNARYITDAMIREGWDVISMRMEEDGDE